MRAAPEFKSFMVFTTETGGTLKAWWASREVYEEAKRTGRLDVGRWDSEEHVPEWVSLKMVAFAPVEDLEDF